MAKPPVPEVAEPPIILKLTSVIPTVFAPGIFFKCTTPQDCEVPEVKLVVLK